MQTESPHAPSRPRLTPKGLATKKRIVSGAAELMYERGVMGATTEEVQQRAGVGASQLFHYFPDKQSLRSEVVDSRCTEVVAAHMGLLGTVETLNGLDRYRDGVVAMYRRRENWNGCPMGRLAGELSGIDEGARTAFTKGFALWEAAAINALRRLRDAGALLQEAPVEFLATGLVASVQGGLLLTQVRRDPESLRQSIDFAVSAIRAHAVVQA